MKTAVVYYSMSGNTQMVAEKVASFLDADLIRLDPVKSYPNKGFRKFIRGGKSALMGDMPKLASYRFDSSRYDQIIFGSPVWASSFAPPLRSFIFDNKEALQNHRFAVFLCYSGGGADKAIEKLRSFLNIESFKAKLTLIDPKDSVYPDNEKRIEEFCSLLF